MSTSVPTDRSKPLKGLLKAFLPGPVALLQGPIGKTGLPLEKSIYLIGITIPLFSTSGETPEEPFGFESREFLRKAHVSHRIEFFIEQMVGTHEYGSLYDAGLDIAIALLEAGLAKVCLKRENANLKPFNLGKYQEAEEKAKKAKKGLWGEISAKNRNLEKLPLEKLFSTYKQKNIKGIIEEFNGSAFTIYSEDLSGFFKFHLNGLNIPPFNYKNLTESRLFLEEKLLQREVAVLIEKCDAGVFLGDISFEKLDVCKELLSQGFAKLSQEAVIDLENARFHKLKEAMEVARSSKLRIWKEHKQNIAKNSKKDDFVFDGKVLEVHSGDSLSIQNLANFEIKRIFLANLRAPALGNLKKAEPEKPWAFESKEFARTSLVGKSVKVEIEYSKTIVPKEKEELQERKPAFASREFGTVWLGDKNFSELLLENGLANVQMPRVDEEFTKYMKNLKEAEEKGKEAKKGVFSSKEKNIVKFNDLSMQKNASKIKAFYGFISGEKKLAGVVERVLNGSRFVLRLNTHSTYIIFALQGIKCLPNDANVKDCQELSNLAMNFSKENLLQRDVEVEIESVDNRGTILGNLVLSKKNFSVSLLEIGLAFVSGYGKTASRYQALYESAEKEAKKAQLGVWKTGLKINESELGISSAKPKELKEVAQLTCCEISNAQEFYFQDPKSKNLHIIERELEKFNDDKEEKLKPPVKPSTPCVALFLDDGKWYRAKVQKHVKAEKYSLFYMDYGNFDEVVLEDIRKMPSKLLGFEPQAILCGLAYVNTPGLEHEMGEEVANWLKERIWNKEIEVSFVYQIKEKKFAILREKDEKDPKKSINLDIIKMGYGKLASDVVLPGELSSWQTEEEIVSGKVVGVWKYDDEEEAAGEDY